MRKEKEPCPECGKSIREQKKGCNIITCYRQYLKDKEDESIHKDNNAI